MPFNHLPFFLFTLLPTYLIRFSIGPIPTTLFELFLLGTVGVGLVLYRAHIIWAVNTLWQDHRWLVLGIGLFLLGATIGVVLSVDTLAALGEWKAFYVEPILLAFTILIANSTNTHIKHTILAGITLSATAVILFTLWQVATGGTFVPSGFWQSDGSFRATAWYGFPNGVGILLGMSLFPALLWFKQKKEYYNNLQSNYLYPVACSLYLSGTILSIYYAQSTGALIGIAAGFGILLLTYTKTRVATLLIGLLALVTIILLPLSHPIKQELLLQDRSGQIRVHMWGETMEMLRDHPIRGAGMSSYADRIIPYHTTVHDEGIEIFHHPHNIFLTVWVNTGIIGLVGFVIILMAIITHLIRTQQWYLLAFFISVIVMGLVDSPYIKNDWAVIFWAMIACVPLSLQKQT